MSALDTGDAEIGADVPKDTKGAPLAIATPAKKPTNQTLESIDWHGQRRKFNKLWQQRTTDDIGADHPMLVWVTKQRKMAAKGRLRTWKRKLLDGIGFPFDDNSAATLAPTIPATLTQVTPVDVALATAAAPDAAMSTGLAKRSTLHIKTTGHSIQRRGPLQPPTLVEPHL
jgi:hypothetical protein